MKGQYFSFDAIIASVIFVMALVALLSYWHSVKSYLDSQNDEISKEAIRISDALLSPPSPSSNCARMSKLGFAVSWDDKRLNSSLINCAASMSEAELKQNLSTAYDVSLTVSRVGADSTPLVTIGSVPSESTSVVKVRRLASVINATNGQRFLAAVDISVYK
ncbi:MAG: hypothetical protein ACP5N9_00575 [Candidatus Bilamarchaeum sp.]|jgi:hypothetical protein